MALPNPDARYYTPDEYFEMDRNSAHTRYEYVAGQIVALAGASINHIRITRNLTTWLDTHLRDGDCEVFPLDLKVKAALANSFRYPDVVVVCGPPAYADGRDDTVTNPTVLIEVLSESTRGTDYITKRREYLSIASLRAYLLVAQDEPRVEWFAREAADAPVQFDARTALDDTVPVPALALALPMREIYRRVSFNGQGDD